MPIWLYEIRPLYAAIFMVLFIEGISLLGLFLARRFLLPRFRYSEGINDAVSGTVQAIGVFYGIKVGLIAVGSGTRTRMLQIWSQRKPRPLGPSNSHPAVV